MIDSSCLLLPAREQQKALTTTMNTHRLVLGPLIISWPMKTLLFNCTFNILGFCPKGKRDSGNSYQ